MTEDIGIMVIAICVALVAIFAIRSSNQTTQTKIEFCMKNPIPECRSLIQEATIGDEHPSK
jgi:hypothetical protein